MFYINITWRLHKKSYYVPLLKKISSFDKRYILIDKKNNESGKIVLKKILLKNAQ